MDAIVYIIDDDRTLVESLTWILNSVGAKHKTFYCAKDFLNQYEVQQRGCILLDVRMNDMSGPELQHILNEKSCLMPIIFMSGYGDIALAVRTIKAGAMDFLTKPFNENLLIETINKALCLNKARQEKILYFNETKTRLNSLSNREKQVLINVVQGKQNKEIARELNLSVKTIEAHRTHLMRKINVKSVPELVKIALLHQKELQEY